MSNCVINITVYLPTSAVKNVERLRFTISITEILSCGNEITYRRTWQLLIVIYAKCYSQLFRGFLAIWLLRDYFRSHTIDIWHICPEEEILITVPMLAEEKFKPGDWLNGTYHICHAIRSHVRKSLLTNTGLKTYWGRVTHICVGNIAHYCFG